MPSSEFHYFSLKNLSLRSFSECFLRCLAGALFLQMMAPHIRTDAECQNQDHKNRGGGVRQCLILTVYLKVPDLDRQCLCRAERVEGAGRGCQVPVAPAQVASGSCGVEERAASPNPRPAARMTPVMMRGRHAGRSTWKMDCHFVAPRPKLA